MHDFEVGYFSPPWIEHEIPYHHLRSIFPITCQFLRLFRLISGIQHLPCASRKLKTTPTRVVVSLVEEAVLATLEGLAEAIEDEEDPPVL